MSGSGQPDYQLSYITDRQTIAALKGIWHDVQLFYDANDNLIYKCVNEIHSAGDGDETWEIWKYTWAAATITGYNCSRIEGPLKGSVTNRATLTWV